MDTLQLLEQKISSLVVLIKELKEKNSLLDKKNSALSKQLDELKALDIKQKDEISVLASKIDNMEKKALEGSGQIDELNQEKALTKMAVDDLLERLKSIDSLVEKE